MNRIFISILVIFTMICSLKAQESNTLYFMRNTPQSKMQNPAFRGEYKSYLGLPFISSLNMSIHTYDLKLSDIIYRGEGDYKDSVVTPFHRSQNPEEFLGKISGSKLSLQSNVYVSMLNYGFMTNDFELSIDWSARFEQRFDIPKNLLELIMVGNGSFEDKKTDFGGLNMAMTYWEEIGIGFNKSFNDGNLVIGVRPKMLFGHLDFRIKKADISLQYVEGKGYDVESDIHTQSNYPITLVLDEDKWFDQLRFRSGEVGLGKLPGNFGIGIDLGFTFRTGKLQLEGSFLDLGFISWKKQSKVFELKGDYMFKGANADGIFGDDTDKGKSENKYIKSVLEEIKNNSTYKIQEIEYTSELGPKINFSANYEASRKLSLGLLSKTHIMQNNVAQSFTLAGSFKLNRFTNATVSYSIMHKTYANLGLGLEVNAGPIQLFLATDNFFGVFQYDSFGGVPYGAYTKNFNLWFGANIVLSKKKFVRRIKHDYPDPFELSANY